ncbi:MAG: hydroxymethylbilane synthase [Ignavibacteriales bacterium]|nr:hydroxymethylbilane synthase [Ignavibacteriales bacterium]
MKTKIILGSRGSELAMWQSLFVKKEIEKKNKNIIVEIINIRTTGDKILDVALSKIGDKGLFTKELEVALLNKSIDFAVHSLKDLQTEIPPGLKLSAVTERHPVEDVLIARKKGVTITDLKEGAIVATGSLRRRAQLLHLRPDIKIVELRGNVPTRINKFLESDWDAIILARAGIERLGLKKHISSIISTKEILPAVGQGALGIEIHIDNNFVNEVLQSIHHQETFIATKAERSLLKALKGGCQVPIGAYAQVKSNGLYLDGLVGSIDGVITFRKEIKGTKKEPEKLGKLLAKDLVKAGAGKVLNEIYKTARAK